MLHLGEWLGFISMPLHHHFNIWTDFKFYTVLLFDIQIYHPSRKYFTESSHQLQTWLMKKWRNLGKNVWSLSNSLWKSRRHNGNKIFVSC